MRPAPRGIILSARLKLTISPPNNCTHWGSIIQTLIQTTLDCPYKPIQKQQSLLFVDFLFQSLPALLTPPSLIQSQCVSNTNNAGLSSPEFFQLVSSLAVRSFEKLLQVIVLTRRISNHSITTLLSDLENSTLAVVTSENTIVIWIDQNSRCSFLCTTLVSSS